MTTSSANASDLVLLVSVIDISVNRLFMVDMNGSRLMLKSIGEIGS